jgi:two-component system phosphate regulon response regulator OmpR
MNRSPKKLLVVDDDAKLRELLQRYLTEQQFEVALAGDATAMNRLMQRETFDLIILDQMLPGEDGLSIIRRLRAVGDRTPIIMLTAKGDDVDRIIGLEMGADDYLPKPSIRVSWLRASMPSASPGEPGGARERPSQDAGLIGFGAFSFDLATRTLSRDGQRVSLTTGEFSVLKVLVRHPRVPLSREKLMLLARGREYGAFDRSLDVQISRLRKLIEPDPQNPRFIQTVWGVGYVFVPE